MLRTIFIAALILSGVSGLLWYNHQAPQASHAALSGNPLLANFSEAELARIHIQGKQDVELRRETNGWVWNAEHYPADPTGLRQLLLKLSERPVGDLITDNPKRAALFELNEPQANAWKDGEDAVRLQLLKQDGSALLDVLLGKNQTDANGQYIRLASSSEIYVYPEKLPVADNPQEWLDRQLLSFPGGLVKELTFTTPDKDILPLLKVNGQWTLAGTEQKINQQTVQNAVSTLASLEFAELLPRDTPEASLNLDRASEIVAELEDGRSFLLTLAEKEMDSGNHAVRLSLALGATDNATLSQSVQTLQQRLSGRPFTLKSWDANDLLQTRDDLLEKP